MASTWCKGKIYSMYISITFRPQDACEANSELSFELLGKNLSMTWSTKARYLEKKKIFFSYLYHN
jgi:hypothetical protein